MWFVLISTSGLLLSLLTLFLFMFSIIGFALFFSSSSQVIYVVIHVVHKMSSTVMPHFSCVTHCKVTGDPHVLSLYLIIHETHFPSYSSFHDLLILVKKLEKRLIDRLNLLLLHFLLVLVFVLVLFLLVLLFLPVIRLILNHVQSLEDSWPNQSKTISYPVILNFTKYSKSDDTFEHRKESRKP